MITTYPGAYVRGIKVIVTKPITNKANRIVVKVGEEGYISSSYIRNGMVELEVIGRGRNYTCKHAPLINLDMQ